MQVAEIAGLVDSCGAALYGFCRRLAGNKADTDDLYQQTFLKAVEMCARIDEGNNPKGLLLSIAVGVWKNDIRKQARRLRIAPEVQADEDEGAADIPDGICVEDTVATAEAARQLRGIVAALHDKFRIPVLLYYMQGLQISEIAAALKLPEGTVKSRLHKARLLIKNEWEAKGYEGIG